MYSIIDIETTGNGLKDNKITEISIFKFDGARIVEEFTSLVNPKCFIPHFITGLTGIDENMVRSAPTFAEISEKVLAITKDCIFVAHAVNFDYGVLKEEFRQMGIDFVRKKLCTVRLSRKLIPDLRSYSLGKLCTALNISITNRHRARGDAKATVSLFQQLLQKPDAKHTIKQFLNARNQEATLPPYLNREVVQNIPNKPGVYYFLDTHKNIIYVGKAKNLKKRVLGHFYDKSNHETKLCREIAYINYELSGSELIALLMESAAIKEHFPKFNHAQKRLTKQYAIFSYEDRKGILHFGFAPKKEIQKPLVILNSLADCKVFLAKLKNAYYLCAKYCQLTQINVKSICATENCQGVCIGKESIESYNLRVKKAVSLLSASLKEEMIIKQLGRNQKEESFIYLKDGNYQGYGFIDKKHEIKSLNDYKAFLVRQKNTVETQRMINNMILKHQNETIFLEMIKFQKVTLSNAL